MFIGKYYSVYAALLLCTAVDDTHHRRVYSSAAVTHTTEITYILYTLCIQMYTVYVCVKEFF